ncbi:hypothetical protein SAMN05445756_0950 [Kytococcus aerolatus]|uniref:Saccharopine dehydrogenase NADP binding domain-containing protein n=2 Tax=Kytococcus aerolatus TaxID=592308 RepID=A0A212TC88_9MICO|nr:hypothetical protein SAMN05445756_0950 [Kytococcus aerolatus]
MKVLVIGGTGVLGSHLVAELRHRGHNPVPVGREVDLSDGRALRHLLPLDAVLAASPAPAGLVQAAAADAGVPSVDVGLDPLPPRVRTALEGDALPHVVGAGFIPGLSGLGAVALANEHGAERVHVHLTQSTNARVGPAGVRAMLGLLADRPPRTPTRPGLGLHHPEAVPLAGRGLTVTYSTAWDDDRTTRLLETARRLHLIPALTALPDRAVRLLTRHSPDRPERAALRWTAEGGEMSVVATGDYAATAAVAVTAAEQLPTAPGGVHQLWEVLTLDDITRATAHVLSWSAEGRAGM